MNREDGLLPVFESFLAALERLKDALAQPKSQWTRDASIQRFEFTFELAWKSIRRFAAIEGLDTPSPRQAVRTAARLGWIEDVSLWLEMLDDRNRSSHTYNEATAESIYVHLPAYATAMEQLIERLRRAAG